MIHPLIYGSVVLAGDSACAAGANATEAPVPPNPTVINLYLRAHILCALIKIMAAIYKLLQNIWQVNLQIRCRATLMNI